MSKKSKAKKVFWIRAENPYRDAFFGVGAVRGVTFPTRKSRSLKKLGHNPSTRQILHNNERGL